MNIFKGYTKIQKYFAIVFILGFVCKYNFFFLRIFNVPSGTGLILKNIIIIIFILVYLFPLVKNNKGREFLFWFHFVFTGPKNKNLLIAKMFLKHNIQNKEY